MSDEQAEGVTSEHRSKVRSVLFRLLRNNGHNISDETEIVQFTFEGEYGSAVISFRMGDGFFDWASRTSVFLTDRQFNLALDEMIRQGKVTKNPDSNKDAGAEIIERQNEETAGLFAYFALEGMKHKLQSAFYELGLETEAVFEGFIQQAMKDHELVKTAGYQPPGHSEAIRALSKSIAAERKQFLTAQIDRFSNKPRLDRLPELYPVLHKVWQSAKRIYEGNSESETWRDMVKAKYPEYIFADDLLTRVTGKLEDLPEDVQARLAETDGDHTPSTIALEHAARMCGAKPYQYGTRYYHRLKGAKTELNETE